MLHDGRSSVAFFSPGMARFVLAKSDALFCPCAMSELPLYRVQEDLFDLSGPTEPSGLRYETDFLSREEEASLAGRIALLPLEQMRYKSYTAKRRIMSYGGQYDFEGLMLRPAMDPPDFLLPLRARVARWAGVRAEDITQILVAEYRPGTPLGWHRDAPDFEDVMGVSLLGAADLRFRPYPPHQPKKSDIVRLAVAPRSIYLLRGAARWNWQHSIAPAQSLRYSLTFRTSVSVLR